MPDVQEGYQETQDGVHVKTKGMYYHEIGYPPFGVYLAHDFALRVDANARI